LRALSASASTAAKEGAEIHIRDVRGADAEAVAAIYAHHVLHGTASYDLEAPSVASTEAKIARITASNWPFLIVEVGGDVIGYAYVTQFRDRDAYAFACEDSIYVHPQWVGRGVGKRLVGELCARAESVGFRQIVAVIGGADPASIALHRSCGFEMVGRLAAVGWKMGRWLDSVYMQRSLGPGATGAPGRSSG
jgi:L-amino acid N-acyltransferase YncA